jgi:hypothetical protein
MRTYSFNRGSDYQFIRSLDWQRNKVIGVGPAWSRVTLVPMVLMQFGAAYWVDPKDLAFLAVPAGKRSVDRSVAFNPWIKDPSQISDTSTSDVVPSGVNSDGTWIGWPLFDWTFVSYVGGADWATR